MAAKPKRIVTWNINSVRLRLPIVLQLIEDLKTVGKFVAAMDAEHARRGNER